MDKQTEDLTSLNALSRELDVNKSRLHYYVKIGILIPILTVGRTQVFERKIALARVRNVDRLQKQGMTLLSIINELNSLDLP